MIADALVDRKSLLKTTRLEKQPIQPEAENASVKSRSRVVRRAAPDIAINRDGKRKRGRLSGCRYHFGIHRRDTRRLPSTATARRPPAGIERFQAGCRALNVRPRLNGINDRLRARGTFSGRPRAAGRRRAARGWILITCDFIWNSPARR